MGKRLFDIRSRSTSVCLGILTAEEEPTIKRASVSDQGQRRAEAKENKSGRQEGKGLREQRDDRDLSCLLRSKDIVC